MFIRKWFSSFNSQDRPKQGEAGQSIVIIAFVMIGLLAFAGIAVDVGFVFARSTQLQTAVDAGVLAGVTELGAADNLADADNRAAQFMRANHVPISVTQTFLSSMGKSPLQAFEYTITATWPVELFFLRVIGLEEVNVTKSATAAYFPLADIYVNRRVEYGFISTANQSIFGPRICTAYGDPYSPLGSRYEPGPYTWRYRIYIPPDYTQRHDVVRIEIFDPDSINANITDELVTIYFSEAATNYDPDRFPADGVEKQCPTEDKQRNRREACVIPTGELEILEEIEDGSITIDQINPYWFVRIDENRGAGAGHGNDECGTPNEYTARYNTQTVFDLFYFAQGSDGLVREFPLASYTGQVGDGIRDNGNHQTDMRWVSPGGTPLYDQPAPVTTSFGSFEVNLNTDVPNILTDPATGASYLYLNITTISGASENGFELWAGPPPPYETDNFEYSSEVNKRNLEMTNRPGGHFSDGVLVFAMGNLPMNSIYSNPIDIPLVYLGSELAGQQVFVSLFDPDSRTQPPIAFFFDSIAYDSPDDEVGLIEANTDWGHLFGDADDPNTEGRCFHVDEVGYDPDGTVNPNRRCTDQWVEPPYALTIPGDISNCDYQYLAANPNDFEYRRDNCTPFYGGRLFTRYASYFADTYAWRISVEGLPYLVR
jgi:hypothetical protein